MCVFNNTITLNFPIIIIIVVWAIPAALARLTDHSAAPPLSCMQDDLYTFHTQYLLQHLHSPFTHNHKTYVYSVVKSIVFSALFAVPSEERSTPENRMIQKIIQALFSPYLTKLISRVTTNEVSGCMHLSQSYKSHVIIHMTLTHTIPHSCWRHWTVTQRICILPDLGQQDSFRADQVPGGGAAGHRQNC